MSRVTGVKLVRVIAGLVPAISIRIAQRPIIGMAGTSPATTKWDCYEFCHTYVAAGSM
jgi:hypothetical protein